MARCDYCDKDHPGRPPHWGDGGYFFYCNSGCRQAKWREATGEPLPVPPDRWGPLELVWCVTCPQCGFQYGAHHRLSDKHPYRCPECEIVSGDWPAGTGPDRDKEES